MRLMLPILGLLGLLCAPVLPQAYAWQDSFEESRQARADGVTAFRAGDLEAALGHMERALTLEPQHPLLLGYVAYLAAKTDNAPRAVEAANIYASLGLVPADDILAALEEALAQEDWLTLKGRFDANKAPAGPASLFAELPIDMRLVEGIAVAPDGGIFLSTVVSQAIYRMEGGAAPRLLTDGHTLGLGSFFGLAYADGQGLYATVGVVPETPNAPTEHQTGLVLIDPASGKILHRWMLPASDAPHQVADICLTRGGTVYVTDALGAGLYRLEGDTLVRVFEDAGFFSPQGIVALEDGTLIMADYGRGLWHLDPATETSALLKAPETTLLGIDGLARHKDRLIAIQNGVNPQRLLAISLSGGDVESVSILVRNLPGLDEPTLGTSTEDGFVFVGASGWPYFGDGGALKDGAVAPAARLLRLQD